MKIKVGLFVGLLFAISISGCGLQAAEQEPSAAPAGEFAIYLPATDLTMDDLVDISHIELAEIPVLSSADIQAYNAATHVIELEASMAELLDALELPGRAFVVAIDRTPIYAGAFMTGCFSRTYDGVVILWPPWDRADNTITIQLGYPGEDCFSGEDPRSDPRILEALRQAGKLR